jgi:hypothetical protein
MLETRRRPIGLATVVLAGLVLATPAAQQPAFMSVDEVQPGMVGVGRTVFAGEATEEFRVNILGVLHNVVGPGRDLILARLEGGPLATSGVMQGMSGSPVFVNGRLLGAVSYALGSFPKEPIAGITPIGEMVDAVSVQGPRTNGRDLDLVWPATPDDVFTALERVAARAAAPLGPASSRTGLLGPAALADMAAGLRPIGAAMMFSGFEPSVDRALRRALAAGDAQAQTSRRAARSTTSASTLEGGDPVGMSLVRGDMEMGATGTVTHVDGTRVYAFGHPFLNLGPTSMAMTEAHVMTYLPSLDSSMKIATMGKVIGTMNQDRATAVGGTLGATPRELEVHLTLASERAPERELTFYVLQDPQLTPLFAYVSVYNALVAYERQTGVLAIDARGSVSFGEDGRVEIDDFFSGPVAIGTAAGGVTAALGAATANTFKDVTAEKLDLRLEISERQETTTIERAWLDTTRPAPGSTPTLHVLLRDYRGGTQTVSLPVAMPAAAHGGLTLLVSDAGTLAARERRDLQPGKPYDWPSLLSSLNQQRRNNRLYVRLIASSTGTVVGGETLPALPASVRSILDADTTVASAPVTQSVLGAWERRLDRAVQGSRELKITLVPRD